MIRGLTTMMYAMVKKVVMPPTNSFQNDDPRSVMRYRLSIHAAAPARGENTPILFA